jgi:hypothetical protein
MTTCKVNVRRVLLHQVKKLRLNLDTNTVDRLDKHIYWDLSRRDNHLYVLLHLRYRAIYYEELKRYIIENSR